MLKILPISEKDLVNHTCLLPEMDKTVVTDCTINTLYFLKFLDKDDAKELAKEANKQRGISDTKVMQIIFDFYQKRNKTEEHTVYTEEKSLDWILEQLPPNHSTMALFHSTVQPVGHALVLYKTHEGQLGIYDPQQEIIVTNHMAMTAYKKFELEKTAEEWLDRYKYDKNKILVLFQGKKRIRKSQEEWRKRTAPPTKKRRLKSKSKSIKSSKSKSKSKSKTITSSFTKLQL